MQQALTLARVTPLLIVYDDKEFTGQQTSHTSIDYDAFLTQGDEHFVWLMPEDEWDAISIN
ncbi:MAG: fatty-acyl-CoA synthase [Flavobacterium sp.]|jgi:fatty-acyl-CoA synthase